MEAYTYYVKKGDNNRVAETPATATADGLVAVTVADYEKEYFLQYWNQYYWDANGDLQSPSDLPSHSEAMLRLTIANQADLITGQSSTIKAQAGTIKSQGEDITALKADNTNLKQQLDLSQNAMLEISDYVFIQPTTSAADTATTATSSATTASSAADGEVK